MILKKIFITLFLVSFLTGCIQNTAFLGPAVTVAGNGNIYQAGLSYVSNETITKITGKTPTGYIKSLLVNDVDKHIDNDVDKHIDKDKTDKEDAKIFFEMVKKINSNSGIKDLTNQ
tara:strand:+ start:106 stop:453 length:348 start_codon:yes stop_codon:yes gene_type:complete